MKTEGSVIIDRPIEEVYQRTLNEVAQWSEIVVEDYVVEDVDDGGVGTRFHTVTSDRGQRMEFDGVVTRSEPPHVHAIEMRGHLFDLEVAYSFESITAQRTRVTQFSRVHAHGAFRVFLTLFGWLMRRGSCQAIQRELNHLKRYCEQTEAA